MYEKLAVVFLRMHTSGLSLAWLNRSQNFRNRHLENKNLMSHHLFLWNSVSGLNYGGLCRIHRCFYSARFTDQFTQTTSIHTVVIALINHLQHIIQSDQGQGYLKPSSPPS